MDLDIQKIRTEAEKGITVKATEWITHALFRAGLEDEVSFNRLQLEAKFAKLNRKNREAIMALAKEIEKTVSLPVQPDAIIKLEKQVSWKVRIHESNKTAKPKEPDSIVQNTFDKKETERVRQLFDVIKLWESGKSWYTDIAEKTMLIPQGDKWYYLWDEAKENSRTIYYLSKSGNPLGNIVLDKDNKILQSKWPIPTQWLTFKPVFTYKQ